MQRFLFLTLVFLLSACVAPAAPTPTATATAMPTPAGLDELPQGLTAVYDGGTWGIKIGEQLIPAVFDSTGLHITSLDSGRTIDIPASGFETRIAYDQELNLLTISDDQGIISAEYDPGVGQPDSPDYIPGQGWVDLQPLADEACYSTSTCFVENVRGLPSGTVNVFFASTGIFRSIDAIDTQTSEPIGELLLLQFVTQNTTGKPAVGWMVIQASDLSRPEVNVFAVISESMQRLPIGSFDDSLQPIEQWQSWMPKGSLWAFGFLPNEGVGPFWSRSQLFSADYQEKKTQFLTSHGDISPDGIYPFFPSSSSDR